MPKTNFDEMKENLTADQLAEYLDNSINVNGCLYCIYRYENCRITMCKEGIKAWLQKEKVS